MCVSECVGCGELHYSLSLQKKYKDEAERLKGSFCLGAQTPEMERVRSNQQHISSVRLQLYSVLSDVHGATHTHTLLSRPEALTPALCRPLAALQLGLQTDAESDVLEHRDTRDHPGQGELQKDQQSTLQQSSQEQFRSCTV